jgi:hypothetical protein
MTRKFEVGQMVWSMLFGWGEDYRTTKPQEGDEK